MGFCSQQLLAGIIGGLPDIVGVDSLPHFIRREGTVLVVPAVGPTIGRCDIELHQVNVLTDDVGRREDLEVIEIEVVRHQVGRFEHDALAGVGSEKEWFRGPGSVESRHHILVEDCDSRLAIVPAEFVDGHVELDVRSLVGACSNRSVQSIAVDELIGAGISKGCSRCGSATVDEKQPGVSRTIEGRIAAACPVMAVRHIDGTVAQNPGMEILRSDFKCCSVRR